MYTNSRLFTLGLALVAGGLHLLAATNLYLDSTSAAQDTPWVYPGDAVEVRRSRSALIESLQPITIDLPTRSTADEAAWLTSHLPGAVVYNYGGPNTLQTVAIGGGAAAHTVVLLDGMPLNSPAWGGYDMAGIPAEILGSIDILTHGGGAQYSSAALGGVVNLSPRIGRTAINISGGSYGLARIGAMYGGARLALAAGTQKYRGDYPYHVDRLTGIREESNSHSAYVYLGDSGAADGNFRWQGLFTSNYRDLPGPLTAPTPGSSQGDEQALVGLSYRLKHKHSTSRWNSYINAQVIRFELNKKDPARVHRVGTVGGSYEFDRSWQSHLGSMTRIEMRHDRYNSTDANIHERTTFGVVQQATLTLAKRLVMIPIMRYNHDAGGLNWLTGEGILRYSSTGSSLLDDLTIVWSKNLRQPGFNDLYWVPGGNPKLDAEKSTSVGIKSRWSLPLALSLGIESTQTQYDQLIQWLPQASGGSSATNLNAASTASLVTYLNGAFFDGRLEMQFGWDHLATKNLTDSHNQGKELRYSPAHQLRFHITTALSDRVELVLNGAGYSRYISAYGVPDKFEPGAGKLDLHLHWNNMEELLGASRLTWLQLHSSLSFINLTDESLAFRIGYPEPGRSVNITITLED
ncbi:TonB-dependent receptor plug domain-containing protein [Candidatus Neomarinimicrobiota bacterium]